ncbi:conserved exported hypothetical protein [Pseudomonas sp. 8BK]|uniref:hypothetical protein n=1 Tax=Pseudomonas TaxID=286 RepID=UPI0012F2F73A|nr:hypothetical protein [Pseudomonas sp. 8BK]VXB39234.1 conserved exported hypothetical protein [Pseudomonas sp. 8BK]
MSSLRLATFLLLALTITGCSTKAWFKLPEHSTISVNQRTEQHPQGLVKTRPFFWNRTAGVPYRLTSATGETLSEGKLRTRFRVVSIFWPPYSIIYWPMGFGQRCYDLSSHLPAECSREDLVSLIKDYRATH